MVRKRFVHALLTGGVFVLLGVLLLLLRNMRPAPTVATHQAANGAVATTNAVFIPVAVADTSEARSAASIAITATKESIMAVFVPATGLPPPTDTPIPADATATPTRDPLATPRPTYQDEAPYDQLFPNPIPNNDAEATLQIPTPTPIQTISAANNSKYSAQNVSFSVNQSSVPVQLQQPDSFTDFAWSPDGKLLAASLITGQVKIYLPAITATVLSPVTKMALFDQTGQQVTELGNGYGIVWSPTSEWIAYQRWETTTTSDNLTIVDIHTGVTKLVAALGQDDTYPYVAWISDTELLYFQKSLFVFDVLSGQRRKFLDDETVKALFAHLISPYISKRPHCHS